MRIEVSRPALRQLADHLEYTHQHNPRAAASLAVRLKRAIAMIGKYPCAGRRQDIEGVRKKVLNPGGYLIFYSVSEEDKLVYILAVVHPAQQRPYSDA